MLGAGVLGIGAFVSSSVAVWRSWLGVEGYLTAVVVSLSVYGASLLVGYLGEPTPALPQRRVKRTVASPHGCLPTGMRRTTRRLSVSITETSPEGPFAV